jgi:hypothetical protein
VASEETNSDSAQNINLKYMVWWKTHRFLSDEEKGILGSEEGASQGRVVICVLGRLGGTASSEVEEDSPCGKSEGSVLASDL